VKIPAAIVALAAAALLAGCNSVPPPTPLDQLDTQQTAGHAVYQLYCASCHHDRTSGDLHGPSLLGMYKKKYLPSGAPANDERVTTCIVHGRNMMPPTPPLTDEQMTDLMAYLHTL
jgi:mono/diheme cytochrome c family protein